MDKRDDGGQAFPQDINMFFSDGEPVNCPEMEGHEGMSLRDYFAGQALANPFIVRNLSMNSDGVVEQHGPEVDPDTVATCIYEYADAMLKARGEDVSGD